MTPPREGLTDYEKIAADLYTKYGNSGLLPYEIAAAIRAVEASALERAADCVQWADEKAKIRALAHSPEAPPAKVNACQVDLRTDKDRECFEDIVQAATRVLRSEPVAPAPSAAEEVHPLSLRAEFEKYRKAEKRIAELEGLLEEAREMVDVLGEGHAADLVARIDAALSRTASPGKGEG